MDKITLNHHPDFVAVIDGRGDLCAAVARARESLTNPVHQVVVIARNSQTLEESVRRSATMLEDNSSEFESFGRSRDGRFARLSWLTKAENIYDGLSAFKEILGDDTADIMTALSENFRMLSDTCIRSQDAANATPHLDFGTNQDERDEDASHKFICPNENIEPLPGSVTATFSLHGGGTIVTCLQAADIERHIDEDSGKPTWDLRRAFNSIARKGWQVADGDLCLMRAKDWPETHFPTLHCSPPRKRDGDSHERLVGVTFI